MSLASLPGAGGLTPTEQIAAFEALEVILSDSQIVNYATLAGFVALLWDVIITLPDEIDFVWKQKMAKGSILYLVMRYGNLVIQALTCIYFIWPNPPLSFCRNYFLVIEFSFYPFLIPVCVIQAMRTYALYRPNRVMKWVLIGFGIIQIATSTVGIVLSTVQIKFQPAPITNVTCSFSISNLGRTAGFAAFGGALVYDGAIFAFTAYRVYGHWRLGNRRYMGLIFRDCLWYYSVLFLSGVATLAMYGFLPTSREVLQGLLPQPMRSLSAVIASRIVLGLRSIVMSREVILDFDYMSSPPAGGASSSGGTIVFNGKHSSGDNTNTTVMDTFAEAGGISMFEHSQ